jgi:hypothetical protein
MRTLQDIDKDLALWRMFVSRADSVGPSFDNDGIETMTGPQRVARARVRINDLLAERANLVRVLEKEFPADEYFPGMDSPLLRNKRGTL